MSYSSRVSRLVLAVLAACAALFAAPGLPTARADVNANQLADALVSYDALYVATGTGKFDTDPALDYLRAAMNNEKLPVYVMVLPKSTSLSTTASQDAMLKQVAELVGRSGTYVMLAGPSLRVHSTALSPATTEQLTEQARRAGGKNQLKVLGSLIKAAGTATQETSAPGPAANGGRYLPPAKKEDSGSIGLVLTVVGGCVAAVLAAGGAVLLRRRKRAGANTAKSAGPGSPAAAAGGAEPADTKPADTPQTSNDTVNAVKAAGDQPFTADGRTK